MALSVTILMLSFVFFFPRLLAFHEQHSPRRLFVTPGNGGTDACNGTSQDCCTLSRYARGGVRALTFSNTEFIFQPGQHRLENNFTLEDLFGVSLRASNDSGAQVVCIECAEGVGFIFRNVTDLLISGLTFKGCSRKLPRVDGVEQFFKHITVGLYFGSVTNLTMTDTIVEKSLGYGLVLVQIAGSSLIRNCSFRRNGLRNETCSNGGNALLASYKCPSSEYTPRINIDRVHFSDGKSGTSSASGLIVLFLNDTCLIVSLTYAVMNGNTAGDYKGTCSPHRLGDIPVYGGGMAVINLNHHFATISITNSNFSEGTAVLGGGLYVHYSVSKKYKQTFKMWMMLENCSFTSNTAYSGGGAYFRHTGNHLKFSSVSISRSSFVRNVIEGVGGAAIVAEYVNMDVKYGRSSILNITDCNITDNRQNSDHVDHFLSFSLISAALLTQYVSDLLIENTCIDRNQLAGITAISSKLVFQGAISISNNSNSNGSGGGIFFSHSSRMALRPNTNVTIASNSASNNGGGVFVEDDHYAVDPLCFFTIDDENEIYQNRILDGIHVLVVNNSAGDAGNQLYGGRIDSCLVDGTFDGTFDRDEVIERVFTFSNSTNCSSISSDPQNLYFCDKDHFKSHVMNMTIYSGENVNVSLMITGQKDGCVAGIIEFTQCNTTTPMPSILAISEISSGCATLALHATALTSVTGTTSIMGAIQVACSYCSLIPKSYLHINFLPTPFGFQSNKTGASSVYTCVKHPPIERFGFECKIENNRSSVMRPAPYWLGYELGQNEAGEMLPIFALKMHCPRGYCKDANVSIHTDNQVFRQEDQCSYNRTGVLCGTCQPNFSLSWGMYECLNCTDISVAGTILFSLICGLGVVAVVCIILFLNLTITEGTMSGFLFYFTSVFVSLPFESPSQPPSMWHALLLCMGAASNAATGLNYCFYDGMDLVGLTWVRFVFVVYLWVVTGAIVVLCQRIQWTNNFVGRRSVPVLATVVLLSHVQLNISVIFSFSWSVLEYYGPDGNMMKLKYVMFYDGDVPFCGRKHLPLLVVGALLGVVSLGFMLLLLCVQPMQRYSHLKCLRWVNRLKPFLDAYSCPHIIKSRCRFWNGFLLLLRSILYLVYVWTPDPWYILSALFSVCVTILFVAWIFGGVYRKKHLQYLNFSYVVNLGVLSLLLKELKYHQYVDGNISLDLYALWLYNVSVTIAFCTFLGTVFYHCYLQMRGSRLNSWLILKLKDMWVRVCRLCRRNNGYHDLDDESSEGPGREDLVLAPSYSYVSVLLAKKATSPQLREPLLMD